MNLQNQLDYLPSLLDGVVVPAPLNADRLKSEIIMQCGLLVPLYSEPQIMKQLIAHWFASRDWNIQHLVKIIQAEYSPIENVDRYDSQTTETSGSDSSSGSESMTSTRNRTNYDNRELGRDREQEEDYNKSGAEVDLKLTTTNNDVSAFNASTYQPANNTETSESDSISTSESGESSLSETIRESESVETSESENISGGRLQNDLTNRHQTVSFEQHMHGNIGVTTNQQMINQELDLVNRFNIYKWITFMLRTDLFLEVY